MDLCLNNKTVCNWSVMSTPGKTGNLGWVCSLGLSESGWQASPSASWSWAHPIVLSSLALSPSYEVRSENLFCLFFKVERATRLWVILESRHQPCVSKSLGIEVGFVAVVTKVIHPPLPWKGLFRNTLFLEWLWVVLECKFKTGSSVEESWPFRAGSFWVCVVFKVQL